MIVTALLVVLLFVLMIFPHELGHFLVAKACGVKVNEFALGMGPAIWKKQKGETLYSLRAVPIGGFCAMEGEDADEESDDPRAFNNKKWWQKILILLAGATMNVVMAFLALTIFSAVQGFPVTTLETVAEGLPAAEAGILPGDRIVAVNDVQTDSWSELLAALEGECKEGEAVTIAVKRGGETLSFQLTPVRSEDGRLVIGIQAGLGHGLLPSIGYGAQRTVALTGDLYGSIKGLFQAEHPMEQVSGPIGIVQVVDQTTTYGGLYYLYILALISLNLAIINLLPLPALDGGRIIFVFIRLITGKAITDRMEAGVHAVGMLLLIAFMVFVTWNDIMRLFQ